MDTIAILIVAGIALYLVSRGQAFANSLQPGSGGDGSAGGGSTGGGGLLTALANAIAQEEGWNVPGSVSQRNNNPGNIGGATQSYATPEAGWAALTHQLNIIFNGTSTQYDPSMTLSEMGMTYANQDPQWGINVASILGVTPDTTLNDLQNIYGGL